VLKRLATITCSGRETNWASISRVCKDAWLACPLHRRAREARDRFAAALASGQPAVLRFGAVLLMSRNLDCAVLK
jgi:hypothetical protein